MQLTKTECETLAGMMLKNTTGESRVPAGWAYIGQIIAHDIVPRTGVNHQDRRVTPSLNLDSIYGAPAPEHWVHSPELTSVLDINGFFILSDDEPEDLPRNTAFGNVARIPDSRNDENRIVAQLHLFWMNVHNTLLKRKWVSNPWTARRDTQLLFQLVVIEGFCKALFTDKVFNHFFRNDDPVAWPFDTLLPAFFALASFRFGHSVVRSEYQLNADHSAFFRRLIGSNKRLERSQVIDWSFFFDTKEPKVNKLRPIDTSVISVLGDVPLSPHLQRSLRHLKPNSVPLFNLLAGKRAKLPSGLSLIQQWQQDPVLESLLANCEVIPLTSLLGATFEDQQNLSIARLPLWPYLLLEAQQQQAGHRLGALGSLLNAIVLHQSIATSLTTVMPHGSYSSIDNALQLLSPKVSEALEQVLQDIRSKDATLPQDVHPIMEALISLTNSTRSAQ